jgi:hypothetical protein
MTSRHLPAEKLICRKTATRDKSDSGTEPDPEKTDTQNRA